MTALAAPRPLFGLPTDALATSIEIAASPARVWAILTDFPNWAAWNPFITSMAGEPRAGTRLTARMEPKGRRPMTMCPLVIEAVAGRSLIWQGRLPISGLFEGTHRFTLTATATGTRLDHGERFRGLLVPLAPAASFVGDFDAMNTALKRRAEAAA